MKTKSQLQKELELIQAQLKETKEASKVAKKTKQRLLAKQRTKQRKEGDQIADQKLLGLNAWAKFLNSEDGLTALYLWGVKHQAMIKLRDLVKALREIDAAKVQSSEMTVNTLINRGKLLEFTKDGQRRKGFNKQQIKRIIKVAVKIADANKLELAEGI